MTPNTFAAIIAVLYFFLVFLSVDHEPGYVYYPAIAIGTGAAYYGAKAFAHLMLDWGFGRR